MPCRREMRGSRRTSAAAPGELRSRRERQRPTPWRLSSLGLQSFFLGADAHREQDGVKQGEEQGDFDQPEYEREDGNFADDDQIIGVIEETIGSTGDQLLARDDDDARGPARAERSE